MEKNLLKEELRHVNKQQEILNKSKKTYHNEYPNKYG